MTGARIVGWGTALPDEVVTNDALAATLDTSDAWIRERTGIQERRIGGTTAGLAVEAAGDALRRAGVAAVDVDQIIVATSTAPQHFPAVAATVQDELGIPGGAFDVNAACAGFVYGLVTGYGLAALGARRVLVVGSDTMSAITDWNDRATAVLFADGAGAVLLEGTDGPGSLLGWDLGNDGTARHLLHADVGGAIVMDGREVYRRAVLAVVDTARRALDRAGLTPDDVALLVPHQANVRIIAAACQRLGIPEERAALVLDRTGNTSAASVPLALADAADAGRLDDGDHVVLVGFGGGMSWASAVVRWGGGP